MDIGFIGLGNMGSAMAGNLLDAGHQVSAYNRSADKVDALAARGARAARTVAEACGGEAVVTMLADDAAVEAVSFGPEGILATLAPGAVHVSASTISLALAERLTDAHADAGHRFVSAPVFGRPEAAAAKKLFVVTAGAPDALTAMSPVFEAVGQRTFVVGEEPKAANLVKLSGNFLIASVIESLGEAMALVTKGGVDAEQYLELLTSTLFDAPVYRTYGGLVARREFDPPGFVATGGLKDVRLALAAGEALQVPLPVASLLRDRFLTLLATGGGHLDWSAIGALAAWEAGAAGPATSDPASDHPA
ncbi:NAD(P)-dependent oxidoreductase [Mycobacterium sp. WMMD1722]|uniref:NAD(P)-dependent oxidoreductase n=1 Tax=Mycobacterium sp. WMMD1722 TaxID=3404117 RepID=UPI003BF49038